MKRRLAAIVAVDVVGYSRLMEQDEAGTFARLRAHRKELFEPQITAHHRHVFKLMGDGLLAEFASVVDAVECAVALQGGMAERNTAAAVEHRIDARIGVNLGDVIVEKDEAGAVDIHGEGVIISNRLQALAEPGGVCVSQTVVNHVGHKIAVGFEFVGEQRVKNITEPVRVYRVLLEGMGRAKRSRLRRRWVVPAAATVLLALVGGGTVVLSPLITDLFSGHPVGSAFSPSKPSIAVLPFGNLSGDSEQAYFAQGLTDDLITDLSKISGLLVTARNSTSAYRDASADVRDVAGQLDARKVNKFI